MVVTELHKNLRLQLELAAKRFEIMLDEICTELVNTVLWKKGSSIVSIFHVCKAIIYIEMMSVLNRSGLQQAHWSWIM